MLHDASTAPPAAWQGARVWGDQGLPGPEQVIQARAPRARDFTNKRLSLSRQDQTRSRRPRTATSRGSAPRSSMCSGVIKKFFGFRKTRYRGPGQEPDRLEVTPRSPTSTWSADSCSEPRRAVGEIGKCHISKPKASDRRGKASCHAISHANPLSSLILMTSSSEFLRSHQTALK